MTAPFADDIKGAVFGVQDSERYNICYRNGFLKKGLHASWYVGMYKAKSHMQKHYTPGAFDLLPLKDFTRTVLDERLRVDIASANNEYYVRHTNNKGFYSEQTTARVARNTVYLQDSFLVLPVE